MPESPWGSLGSGIINPFTRVRKVGGPWLRLSRSHLRLTCHFVLFYCRHDNGAIGTFYKNITVNSLIKYHFFFLQPFSLVCKWAIFLMLLNTLRLVTSSLNNEWLVDFRLQRLSFCLNKMCYQRDRDSGPFCSGDLKGLCTTGGVAGGSEGANTNNSAGSSEG